MVAAPPQQNTQRFDTLSLMKRIALLSERLRAYGRRICEGVAAFAQEQDDWSLSMLEWEDLCHPARISEFDGFIARVIDEQTVCLLSQTGKPVVDVYGAKPRDGFVIVDHNARKVGQLAARHFIEHQFVHFAFLGFNRQSYSNKRQAAFVRCLELNHFPCDCYEGKDVSPDEFANLVLRRERYSKAKDSRAIANWLAKLPKPVAILCSHDLRAYQLLEICKSKGISVPNEVAILGVDNDPLICTFSTPSLSSIDPDAFSIGLRAAQTIDAWLSHPDRPPKSQFVTPSGLTARRSSEVYPVDPPWLSDALVFIRRNVVKRLTATDVFSELKLSHTLVERTFKRKLGFSVQQAIRNSRIDEARRLLKNTALSLQEITRRAGFSTPQYFSTEFLAATGHTPLQYRNISVSGQMTPKGHT